LRRLAAQLNVEPGSRGYDDITDGNMDEEHIDRWIGVVIEALSELDFGDMS
jgi:hypothetical protein